MESSELSLKGLPLGERMVLAAQLAVARHWFNAEQEREQSNSTVGGADPTQRITDDPRE